MLNRSSKQSDAVSSCDSVRGQVNLPDDLFVWILSDELSGDWFTKSFCLQPFQKLASNNNLLLFRGFI